MFFRCVLSVKKQWEVREKGAEKKK